MNAFTSGFVEFLSFGSLVWFLLTFVQKCASFSFTWLEFENLKSIPPMYLLLIFRISSFYQLHMRKKWILHVWWNYSFLLLVVQWGWSQKGVFSNFRFLPAKDNCSTVAAKVLDLKMAAGMSSFQFFFSLEHLSLNFLSFLLVFSFNRISPFL